MSAQKKRGQFMSGFVPYGYVKDPADKHRFLVDEEAAKDSAKNFLYVVWKGYSRNGIAKETESKKES